MARGDSPEFIVNVPIRVDVAKLDEAFSQLSEEQVVTHEEMESVLDMTRNTHRYRMVVRTWIDQLLYSGQNLLLISIRNVGYSVATAQQRMDFCKRHYKKGCRTMTKVSHVARTTDIAKLPFEADKRELRRFMIDIPSRLQMIESVKSAGNTGSARPRKRSA